MIFELILAQIILLIILKNIEHVEKKSITLLLLPSNLLNKL